MYDAKIALDAKVKAVNKANAYATKLYPMLASVFKPLVGQKVLKADGSILAKYAKLMPDFLLAPEGIHVCQHMSKYSLA